GHGRRGRGTGAATAPGPDRQARPLPGHSPQTPGPFPAGLGRRSGRHPPAHAWPAALQRRGHGHSVGLRPAWPSPGYGLPGTDAPAGPDYALGATDGPDRGGAAPLAGCAAASGLRHRHGLSPQDVLPPGVGAAVSSTDRGASAVATDWGLLSRG